MIERHGYTSERSDVQALVPDTARRILDLGCSVGALGAVLKRRNGAEVVGVELDPDSAHIASSRLDHVVVGDIGDVLTQPLPGEPFDCLIAADVLEHLVDPWAALRHATAKLAPDAVAIIALPNILYWPGLLRVILQRRWPRDDEGIFDRTHLRWFTPFDAIDLIEQADLSVTTTIPKFTTEGLRLWLTKLWSRTSLRVYLGRQWLFVAVSSPSSERQTYRTGRSDS